MREGHLRKLLAALGRSPHRGVLSAAAVVAAGTFVARLLGAGKEVFVARQFGTGDAVDAFLVAWLVPASVISIAGTSLHYALLPVYLEARRRAGVAAAQETLAASLATCLLVTAGLVALLYAALPPALAQVVGSFGPEKLRLTGELFRLLAPSLLFSVATSTWTAVLNAEGRFIRPALGAVAIPCAAVAALLLFGRRWGIHALALGTTAGYLVEALVAARGVQRAGLSVLPRWGGQAARVRRVGTEFVTAAASMIFTALSPVIDQVMAAWLAPGSVAALGYGGKLVSFAMGIGYGSLGAAMLPHFSRMAADRDWSGLESTIRAYVRVAAAVSVPLTACAVALSPAIVRGVFERGTFTHGDTVIVARVQALYLLQVPFVMTSLPFVRFIVATRANRLLLRVAAVSAVLNVAANYALMWSLGVAGIALSTALVYAVSCGLNWRYYRRQLAAVRATTADEGGRAPGPVGREGEVAG